MMMRPMEPLDEIRARLATVDDPVTLLEGFFAHAPCGLQVYRRDGDCLLVNRAFVALFGSTTPVLATRELMERAFAGETVRLAPSWYDVADRRVAIGGTFFPLFDVDGKVAHVAGVFEDHTESEEDRERIRRLSAVKDEFLGIASHELRTPLTTMRASVQAARTHLAEHRDVPAVATALEALARAERQTDRMSRLVEELLDGARVERGGLQLHRRRVDLREVVEQARADALDLVAHLVETTLPDTPIDCDVDADRVAQLLTNLITNAARHSASDRPIELRLEGQPDRALLRVIDHGRGIDASESSHIFERFYRSKHSTGGGLGLGLYISAEIARLHGGTLTVDSRPGAGAIFTLTLPL